MQPDGGAGQRKRASRQGRRGGADPSRGRGSVSLFTRGGTAEIFFVSVDRGQGAIRSWSVSPVRRLAHEDRRIPRRSNAEWSLRSAESRAGGGDTLSAGKGRKHTISCNGFCVSVIDAKATSDK